MRKIIVFLIANLIFLPLKGSAAGSTLTPIEKFYVIAEKATAGNLIKYCDKTEIPCQKIEGSKVQAGPFMSGYEANLLTGLVPHSRTVMKDDFESGVISEGIKKKAKELEADEEKPIGDQRISLERVSGSVFYKIWKTKSQAQIYYFENAADLFYVAGRGDLNFYQDSFGLDYLDSDDIPFFITLDCPGRGSGNKTEDFVVTSYCKEYTKRIEVVRIPATEFDQDEGGNTYRFMCSRLSFKEGNLYIKYFNVVWKDASKSEWNVKWGEDTNAESVSGTVLGDIVFKESRQIRIGKKELQAALDKYDAPMRALPASFRRALIENTKDVSGISADDVAAAIGQYFKIRSSMPDGSYVSGFTQLLVDAANGYKNDKRIRSALLNQVDSINTFDQYWEFIPTLMRITDAPEGKIEIKEIGVTFTFSPYSAGRNDVDFDWEKNAALIRKTTKEWVRQLFFNSLGSVREY